MSNMQCLYRISDGGNPKKRLNVATKMCCLDNFINEFKTDIHIFADNCSEKTISELHKRDIKPNILSLGNSRSWRYIVEFAIANFSDDTCVYMVEDDYLHLPGSNIALNEGIQIADYVTLYDNPDKYVDFDRGGPNPYVKDGGELTRVLFTEHFHWKQTNSATMTFATRVKTLKEDKELWWHFTHVRNPYDFFAFQLLTGQKFKLMSRSLKEYIELLPVRLKYRHKRIVINAIPGLATHAELAGLTPLTHWHSLQSWEDFS